MVRSRSRAEPSGNRPGRSIVPDHTRPCFFGAPVYANGPGPLFPLHGFSSAPADALPGNIATTAAVGRMEIGSSSAVVRVGHGKWCRSATRALGCCEAWRDALPLV
jgi:hypothetical protein